MNIATVHEVLGQLEEAEGQLLQVVAMDEALGLSDLESDRAVLAQVQAMRRARQDKP